MGVATFIKLGKTAMDGKKAYDSFDSNMAYGAGKKAATAPLKAWENVPRLVVRGLQFLFALVVIGFYGHRVDVDRRTEGARQSPEWIYGVFVGGASCVAALLLALAGPLSIISSRLRTYRMFAADLTLFLLWIVVFGIFGGIFLRRTDKEGDYKGASTSTQRHVVWLDLVNALLWLVSGVYGAVKTCLGNKVDGVGDKVTGKVTSKLFGRKKETKQWYGQEQV
ncbi:uncharacterized protein E0L32_007425 [Thyridium curvatum]|uniref:MARVEL domain-containing protein n=1 Tax=Thyridium curvatum TaxID=1093900 RepID=A0A507AWS4_9PEZI|nr:uncharacterized protein E0L32_007425 [Thyridium curvatum]TPX11927.1 hypothetical protein E0L32_007425 [Thyridium curvatum]